MNDPERSKYIGEGTPFQNPQTACAQYTIGIANCQLPIANFDSGIPQFPKSAIGNWQLAIIPVTVS
jgi:hypothetical protein